MKFAHTRWPLYTMLLLVTSLLVFASPIADAQLEKDINRFFDAYQLERPDPIEFISRYSEIGEAEYDYKNKAGQVFRIRFIDIKFYVHTKRKAEENFILRTRYYKKDNDWVILNHTIRNYEQTQEPKIKPARIKAPEAKRVLELIKSRLKEESSPAVTYHLHKIELTGEPRFAWDKNYSKSRYRYPVSSKVYTVGRVPSDKEFFQCNWVTMIEYNTVEKKWQIHTLDQATGPRAIVRGCVKLYQNTEEKIEDLFPGEGKTKIQ